MIEKRFACKVFVMPVGACSYEKSWQFAADVVAKKLQQRFGDIIEMRVIEIFSPESFSYQEIIEGLKMGNFTTPLITVNERIIQSGGKLSESTLRKFIESELASD